MFDNMKIAGRIKQARIHKNMTQMNLADAMGVSYQAVSNWERGTSLPDISKLDDLCTALDLSLQQLLGMDEPAAAAAVKALQEEPMTMEEIREVAPMLPPKTVREQVEQERKQKKIDFSALADIAPFLDEEYLDSLVADADPDSLEGLDEIAPFLSERALESLVDRAGPDHLEVFEDVLCFLGRDAIDRLLLRCLENGSMDTLEAAAVFASEGGLEALVDACIARGREDDLSGIYPFLGKKALRKLAEHMMKGKNLDGLGGLMVFL